MKVLQVGPSPTRSKGGMSTVISEILGDEGFNTKFQIFCFESYIDGNKFKVMLYSVWAIVRFILAGEAKKYDVYHIHVASFGSMFRKKVYLKIIKNHGKKAIFHIHSGKYMQFFESLTQRKKKKVIQTLRSADMVIALSDEWKQKFDDTFGLHNCVVLENGIDRERLLPAVSEPYQFRKSFLALGRLGKNKGTYDLVDAVEIARKNIPDLICYLAGDGEVDKFRSIVQERGLQKNIVVVGWVDFEKKLEILSKTATVVLPSYHEGLPMAILEGMACGKAIISTTVGAIPEVVTEKNGILIEPGDITALATALVEFCNNAERLRSISQNNIRKIDEEFSMSKMHERLQHYYEMCFNSK